MSAVGDSVRAQARKGPSDGVTKVVSEAEADAAWGGSEGPVGTMEDRNAGKALPAKGIRLVSPGGPNSETAPDSRAAANLAARKARQRAQAPKTAGSPDPAPAAPPAPVQAPEAEDWETAVQAEIARTAAVEAAPGTKDLQEHDSNDLLERSRKRALTLLSVIPPGCELFVGQANTPDGLELVMGLGYLIGKGLAVYRGDGHYRLQGR